MFSGSQAPLGNPIFRQSSCFAWNPKTLGKLTFAKPELGGQVRSQAELGNEGMVQPGSAGTGRPISKGGMRYAFPPYSFSTIFLRILWRFFSGSQAPLGNPIFRQSSCFAWNPKTLGKLTFAKPELGGQVRSQAELGNEGMVQPGSAGTGRPISKGGMRYAFPPYSFSTIFLRILWRFYPFPLFPLFPFTPLLNHHS